VPRRQVSDSASKPSMRPRPDSRSTATSAGVEAEEVSSHRLSKLLTAQQGNEGASIALASFFGGADPVRIGFFMSLSPF